jgi:nitrite reductase (NADH) small subunit
MTAGMVDLRWETVCRLDRLQPERGVAALVGDRQVALFRTHDGTVHALGNVDPFSGAAVLSRGIVGDRGGVPMVASPVYKQAFSLVDGRCLDDPAVAVPSYPVRVVEGWLQVGTT